MYQETKIKTKKVYWTIFKGQRYEDLEKPRLVEKFKKLYGRDPRPYEIAVKMVPE